MAGSVRQVAVEYVGKATGLTKATRQAEDQLDKFADTAEQSGEKAGAGLGKKLRGGMEKASAGLDKIAGPAGAGAGAAFGASLVGAMGKQDAAAKLGAQLNLTKKQSAQIGKVAGNLYAQNYGESMEDVTGAVGAVRSNIAGMNKASSKDLQNTTKYALSFAKAMDVDVADAAVSAGALVNNGLAKNGKQAFDLLTAGAQKAGPQMVEPVLDATNEYSKHFKMLGFDGKKSMGILASAASGGEIAIDKAGDAVKEFGIRATDLNDTGAQQSLKKLGLNGKEMANDLLAGGKRAAGATKTIADGLLKIQDPAKRAKIASGLFGTQIEDIGKDNIPGFLKALTGADDGLGKVDGRAAKLDKTLNATATGNIDTFKRQAQSAFVSVLGDTVLPIFTKFTGQLTGNQKAMKIIVGTVVGLAGGVAALSGAIKVVTVVTQAWSVAQKILNSSFLTNPVFLVIAGIVALGAALVIAYKKSETFRNIVNGAFAGVKKVAGAVVGWFTGSVVPFFTTKLPGAGKAVLGWFKKNWPTLLAILTGPIGLAVLAVTKNWDKIKGAFSGAKKWVSGTWKKGWSGAKQWIGGAVEGGRDKAAAALTKTRSKLSDLKSWAGSTWKKSWSAAKSWISDPIGTARDRAGKFLDKHQGLASKLASVKSWAGTTWKKGWSAAKGWIADPIGKAKSTIQNQLGAGGTVRKIFDGIDSWGRGTFGKQKWAKIKGVLTAPLRGAVATFSTLFGRGGKARTLFTGWLDAVRGIFGKLKGAIQAPIRGLITGINHGLIKGGINWILGKLGVDRKNQVPWIPMPKFAGGDRVRGATAWQRSGTDRIPAMLDHDEVVIRRSSAQKFGYDKLSMINRYGALPDHAAWPHLAGGGIVKPTRSGRINPSYAGHSGIDFFGNVGDPILAATAGRITYLGSGRGYGNAIFETSDKGVQMVYGHTSAYSVGDGQQVRAGQTIGKVGYSGNVRPPGPGGAHLHFEVAPGGGFAQAGNRDATFKWLSGSGIASKVIGAISGALNFLGKLSPVQWLMNKAAGVAGNIGGGAFGAGLGKSVPGMIIDKAKDWIGEKIGSLAGDVTGATWSGGQVGSWDGSQLNVAATIIKVARSLGFGDRGAQIGLMTGMQESTLRNLSGGDRDSVGVFQQRAPWGPYSARHNPAEAARMFYLGGQGGQPGLGSKNWRGMGLGQAAQAVQVSALPGAYDRWAAQAGALVAKYDTGGSLPPGLTLAYNGTGKNETVRTAEQEAALAARSGSTVNHYEINVYGATDRMAAAREIKKLLDDLDRATGRITVRARTATR